MCLGLTKIEAAMLTQEHSSTGIALRSINMYWFGLLLFSGRKLMEE